MTDSRCAVCQAEANQRCAKCHVTSYCSKEHQKQHWKQHRAECSPYRVGQNETLGRFLEASRDILPGEVILRDAPLVLGPRQVTIPVCLGCFNPVDGSYSCPDCGWPLCGPQCQKVVLHNAECQLSRNRSTKIQVKQFMEVNQMYECITPLRCLWLKANAPERWAALMQMESHVEARRTTDVHEVNQTNVVDFMKQYLKVQSFEDEEVHRVCGVIDVNGFEIPGPSIIGLYGKACLLEHDCVPNTTRTFDAGMNIVIRAAVHIAKGEHIKTSYTDPMWGTANRQMHLRNTKYFKCVCARCLDPTEMGTHLSSLRCTKCPKGAILPMPSPVSPDAWACDGCEETLNLDEVEDYLRSIGEKLICLKEASLQASENFLKETAKKLSDNHYYRSDVKLALAQMYGRSSDERHSNIQTASKDLLERKERLCREVLALADTFCPGKSRLRGLLLYELQCCLMERCRRLPKKLKSSAMGKNLLKESVTALEEASEILLYESPLQDEYQLGLQAEDELKTAKNLLSKHR